MSRFTFLGTIWLGISALMLPAWAESYLSFMPDIPLPEGYQEDMANRVIFDAPSGRVITQHAFGNTPAQAIETYYKSSLPALGWRLESTTSGLKSLTFLREGEMLDLEIKSLENGTHIHFHLTPAP